ncbi:alpha/beta hydrolase [Corynebacterium sp. 335C]
MNDTAAQPPNPSDTPQPNVPARADAPARPHRTPTRVDLVHRIEAAAAGALVRLPEPLLKLLVPRPRNARGDRVAADVALSLALLKVVGGSDGKEGRPVGELREAMDLEASLACGRPPRLRMNDVHVAGVPCREYLPPQPAEHPAGATILYLHGGGWTLGSLETHDAPCRHIAAGTGVRVVSADYRMAPEAPFPAAVDDVMAVYRELAAAGPVVVMGDSAGGNLAAVLCLVAREEGLPQPALQGLIVPAVDLAGRTASRDEFAEGFFLTDADMDWYTDQYGADHVAEGGDLRDWRISPLHAEDLSGLAPAYVAVAGFDPLRDEGEAYAAKLADAGVPVTLRRHPDMVHPFINSPGIWRGSRAAIADLVGAVRLALGVR